MPDNNDEPQSRRRPGEELGSSRPTRDREARPNLGPDLDGPQNLGNLEPRREPPRSDQGGRARPAEPELRRADRDQTRQRAGGVGIPDELRGYLDRLGDIEDEISDQEAARRAGLTTGDAEPEPPEYQDLPAIIRNDLANIGGEIAAAGMEYPEWHTINNLPGYMQRAIRAMGRGNFRMFTRTDLEDIITIANVGGKGPNTESEVKAVAAWLMQNAENLGPVEIDYSQIMPGYEPEVVEFRTEKTRFHVVRDPAGVYIYAYPEKDAIDRTGSSALPSPEQDDERDEFGARIKRISKESKMENKFSSVSEQIRHYTNVLESLQEQAQEEHQFQELWESWVDSLVEASSLTKLLAGKPGGKPLAIHLHKQYKLASGTGKVRPGQENLSITPNYEVVPERVHASAIKASKDNFAIIVGATGVAGVKVLDDEWETSRNPERDNTLRYRVVWSANDEPVDTEIQKYRLGLRSGGGGTSGAEGGAPNLFQVLIQRIGSIQDVYITKGAVERLKSKTRQGYKSSDTVDRYTTVDSVVTKLKPILSKLLNSAVGNIQQRVGRLSQAGNFAQSQELAAAGAKIQDMLTALDTANPDWEGRELRRFGSLVGSAISKMTAGKDTEQQQEILKALSTGRVQELGELLNAVRQGLYKLHQVY